MKRFSVVGITLLLLFALANCGEHHGDPTETSEASAATGEINMSEFPTLNDEELSALSEQMIGCAMEPSLSFASLEDLSNGCIAAREGGDLASFVSGRIGPTESSLADIAEEVNLAALEKIYVPTGVPEPYRLNGISVAKSGVGIRYCREEDLISDDPARILRQFAYTYSRSDLDSPLNDRMQHYGVTKEDLIEGKYLFNETSYTLDWELDGGVMNLKLPTSLEVYERKISLVEYLGLSSIEDLAQFAEVKLINLG